MLNIALSLIVLWSSMLIGQTLNWTSGVFVSPNLTGTRCQMWPVAAYSNSGQCWLIVWREGHINEQETDLYCGRIDDSGASKDSAGICITSALDIQEYPAIATDGTDFFVVWQDYRNGSDFDIYGARVTATGQVLDTAGILIAGGLNNQCSPSIVYCNGQYHVFWQSFNYDTLAKQNLAVNYTATGDIAIGYQLYGTTVSTGGVVQNSVNLLSAHSQSMCPTALSVNDDVLLCFDIGGTNRLSPTQHLPATLKINGVTGSAAGNIVRLPPSLSHALNRPGAAFGIQNGLLSLDVPQSNQIQILKFNENGTFMSNLNIAGSSSIGPYRRHSIAFDGENYLFLSDWTVPATNVNNVLVQVRGMLLPGNGVVSDTTPSSLAAKMQVVSDSSATKDRLQGVCTAGKKGSFLVAYAEFLGVDSIKIKAKVASYGVVVNETRGTLSDGSLGELIVTPNPFNPGTSITLTGKLRTNNTVVTILGLDGRLVKNLYSKSTSSRNQFIWDGKDAKGVPVVSGVYIIRGIAGDKTITKRILLMK